MSKTHSATADIFSTPVTWPMSTHTKGVCLIDGLEVPHSHYGWAKNLYWKAFGLFVTGKL